MSNHITARFHMDEAEGILNWLWRTGVPDLAISTSVNPESIDVTVELDDCRCDPQAVIREYHRHRASILDFEEDDVSPTFENEEALFDRAGA